MSATETVEPFVRRCPECHTTLSGVLIHQLFITAKDIARESNGVVSERAARGWMRWCRVGRLPGKRHPVVDAQEFVVALEAHKRHGRRDLESKSPSPAPQSACSICGHLWDGVLARLQFLTVPDVVDHIGGGFGSDTIERWIRCGEIRAFKIAGVRGPLVEADHLASDLAAMRNRYMHGSDRR